MMNSWWQGRAWRWAIQIFKAGKKVGIDQAFDEVEDVFDGNLIIKWRLIRLMVRFK